MNNQFPFSSGAIGLIIIENQNPLSEFFFCYKNSISITEIEGQKQTFTFLKLMEPYRKVPFQKVEAEKGYTTINYVDPFPHNILIPFDRIFNSKKQEYEIWEAKKEPKWFRSKSRAEELLRRWKKQNRCRCNFWDIYW